MNADFYKNRKMALVSLIRHYEENCLKYLDYAAVNHMSLDDLYVLYSYDNGKVEEFNMQLLILEAENLLNI